MKTQSFLNSILAVLLLTFGLLLLAPSARGTTNILQWSFTSKSGNVTVPIADTSGFSPAHPASNLIHGGQPTYSADIPTNTRSCTGIGSVSFSGAGAGLSTANSVGVTSGQNIVSAAQIYAAGGLTMEIWLKNPSLQSGATAPCYALLMLGMYGMGVVDSSGNVGYSSASGLTLKTTTPPASGQWLHLAVVMANPNAACTNYNVSLYLNGDLVASGTDTLPWFLTRATCVGSWQYGANCFYQGLVYEPRVTLGVLATNEFTVVPQPPQPPPTLKLEIASAGNNVVLTWANTNGVLEWAPTPAGPWTPVAATGHPYWRWANGILVAATAWAGPYAPVTQPASPYTFVIEPGVPRRFFHLRLPPALGDADYALPSPSTRHTQKVALVQSTNSYPLVLIGDSITQTIGELGGNYAACSAVWNKHYAPRNALNLGYNGYRTQEILWNLENGELEFPVSPKVFRILIGCNNAGNDPTSGNTASQIMAGTKAIVDLIRQRHPTSKILLIRILPRGGTNQISQVTTSWNFAASAYAMQTCNDAGYLTSFLADGQHVFWLDIGSVFLQPGSVQPPPGQAPAWSVNTTLLWDLLHPGSPDGCEAWCEAIEPTLSQLMGDTPL